MTASLGLAATGGIAKGSVRAVEPDWVKRLKTKLDDALIVMSRLGLKITKKSPKPYWLDGFASETLRQNRTWPPHIL
jgi:hypothetical protein